MEPMKDKSVKFQLSSVHLLIIGVFSFLLLHSNSGYGPEQGGENIRVMFYNVENLFDTLDSDLDDDEFLPGSMRRWNTYKYWNKLRNLRKVIMAAGEWSPPSLIGLCEVENSDVLSDLLSTTVLKRSDYEILYSEGADSRGIGVALLYRKTFSLLSSRNYYPIESNGDTILTRSVHFAKFSYREDTLGIIVTHWPSRRGGVSATDKYRNMVSSLIRDKILAVERDTKIIIMGDFNCEPNSSSLQQMIRPITGRVDSISYFNPVSLNSTARTGSYKYQGRWLNYDQIIIDRRLIDVKAGLQYREKSFSIVQEEFLLTNDKTYRGVKPRSTWAGPGYIGGFSDHLPLIADFVYID